MGIVLIINLINAFPGGGGEAAHTMHHWRAPAAYWRGWAKDWTHACHWQREYRFQVYGWLCTAKHGRLFPAILARRQSIKLKRHGHTQTHTNSVLLYPVVCVGERHYEQSCWSLVLKFDTVAAGTFEHKSISIRCRRKCRFRPVHRFGLVRSFCSETLTVVEANQECSKAHVQRVHDFRVQTGT